MRLFVLVLVTVLSLGTANPVLAADGQAPEAHAASQPALDAALHDSRERSPHELRDTVALLETVRRALIRQKRTGHGLK